MQHAVVFVCTYKCVCKQSYVTDVLQTPFYNTILETEHKLCMASGLSPPPPQMKNVGCAPGDRCKYKPLVLNLRSVPCGRQYWGT